MVTNFNDKAQAVQKNYIEKLTPQKHHEKKRYSKNKPQCDKEFLY